MYQVGPSCYATKLAALHATASSQAGAVVQHAGAGYVVTVDSVTESAIAYRFNPVAGGAGVVQTVLVEPAPCGLLTVDDVLPIAWAIFGGWIAIFLVKQLWESRV